MKLKRDKSRLCCAVLVAMYVFRAYTQSTAPALAQHSSDNNQPAAIGGVRTGTPRPAVLDSEHRPITAGGFVKTGPVIVEDISESSGLAKWRHSMGTQEKECILETVGSGVGLIDYDNDGWLDIYLVNGATYDSL